MTNQLSHHDSFFKKFLGDIAVARDFLEIHLPEHLRQQCDLSTLAMCSGSFIEDDLRSHCSDMLYSLKAMEGDVYIYCLIEHQSRPESMMAFRLLRYAVTAMHRHLEQGNKQLPVVIPLLFYHGTTSPYPYTTHWLDCFADRKLAESVYAQAFPLVDVTAMDDDEIRTHRRVALMELVQKHIRTRDMLELTQQIATLINQWPLQPEQFRGLMYYIFERGNTSSPGQFLHDIATQTQDYREDVMTIAEQLRQEGEQKGYQLGRQDGVNEGMQQGKQEATRQLAKQLLADGVGRSSVKRYTGLSDEELDSLVN